MTNDPPQPFAITAGSSPHKDECPGMMLRVRNEGILPRSPLTNRWRPDQRTPAYKQATLEQLCDWQALLSLTSPFQLSQ